MPNMTNNQVDNFVDLLTEQARKYGDKPVFLFLEDGENVTEAISYAELARRAKATAVHLMRRYPAGSRILLLYPSCIDYMVAFFGSLCAGMIAVPVFPPRGSKHNGRLEAIVRDSQAAGAMTTTRQLQSMEISLRDSALLSGMDILCSDLVSPSDADNWRPCDAGSDTLAFLQYTSGSTGHPKGVMVSHGNLIHNERMIQAARHSHHAHYTHSDSDTVYVTWLPIYHDMGLIGSMLHSFWQGATCYFMAPVSFLMRPVRWLQAISNFGAAISGGPNFAYQLCADKVAPEAVASLDLSSWEIAFNGSEPIRPETLNHFYSVFAPAGFHPEAWAPCYGLAESTLMAAARTPGQLPATLFVEKEALGNRHVIPVASGKGVPLIGCGSNLPGQEIRIVDPLTCKQCAPGDIGEIWLSGPHIGQGYWQHPETTESTFHARIAGSNDGLYLRTGDLGFLHDMELYVAGRLKDVMIVRGINYYPQDIEAVAEAADEAINPNGCAAFAVNDAIGERIVAVAEVHRSHLHSIDPQRLSSLIRMRVLEQQEVVLSEVVLIRPGSLPRTSSGKVQRSRTRELYLSGGLALVEAASFVE